MSEGRRTGFATTHDDLVNAMRARKEELGLSNAFVEEIGGLAAGECDKILGATPVRGLNRQKMDILLEVFALSLVVVEDPDKLRRMERRYEGRDNRRVHFPAGRINQRMLERAKPVIVRENGRLGGLARAARLSAKLRREIARKAGLASAAARKARRREQASRQPQGLRPRPTRTAAPAEAKSPAPAPSRRPISRAPAGIAAILQPT